MQESLEELNVLVKRWPKEPSIYVSRGKVGSLHFLFGAQDPWYAALHWPEALSTL